MDPDHGPRCWLSRNLVLILFFVCLITFSLHSALLVFCWTRVSSGNHHAEWQNLSPVLHSSSLQGRDKRHCMPLHERLPAVCTALNRVCLGVFSTVRAATERSGTGAETISDASLEVPTPSSGMQGEVRTAAHELAAAELGRLLQNKDLVPRGTAARAALVRTVRSVLGAELQALVETEAEAGGASAQNSHKRKLRKRLEALLVGATAQAPAQDDCGDCPRPLGPPTFNPVIAQASQKRHFSWDGGLYSVRQLLGGTDHAGIGTDGLPPETDLVQLQDQLLRVTVSLPALLTSDEVNVAFRQLPTISASEGKEPLFQGPTSERSSLPVGARRIYGLPELLKDLKTTCILLCAEKKHSRVAGTLVARPAAQQATQAGTSVKANPPGPDFLSLFSLLPEIRPSEELIGAVYCAGLDGLRDSPDLKRRGIVLLPGKIQPRDARVRYLADRIAHSCKSLVVVPELAPSSLVFPPPERPLADKGEGRMAAARLRLHGMQALVARALLWLHLYERAEALAVVGLGEGGAEALRYASGVTAASQAAVALPPRDQLEAEAGHYTDYDKIQAAELRGLPQIDAAVALYPSDFDVNAVAATLKAPTLSLFEPQGTKDPKKAATAASQSRATAFESALKTHGHTRDYWVKDAPRPSGLTAEGIRELVGEDVLLMATSWLDLWMGSKVPEHVDAVADVSGFELSFRHFHQQTPADVSAPTTGDGDNSR